MEKRSDSDILLKELTLKFGEKEYIVPVLRMKEAAKWRGEYFKRTEEVSDSLPMKFDQEHDPQELSKANQQRADGIAAPVSREDSRTGLLLCTVTAQRRNSRGCL